MNVQGWNVADAAARNGMRGAVALLAAALLASPTLTADAAEARPRDPVADRDMVAAGFLTSHPDLRYRGAAVDALRDDAPAEALRNFTRAARYADKPSQAAIGEMYWEGNGVPVDRALGYAWMDLAAERGYRPFVIPARALLGVHGCRRACTRAGRGRIGLRRVR